MQTNANPRMPMLAREQMTPAQQAAADELAAGPRKGVKGPFIPLLRSPELMARMGKVGEFLRFGSSLSPRASEFATLVVARHCSQQFEWFVHVPLALKAGTDPAAIEALREGRRPAPLSDEEQVVHDAASELLRTHGLSDGTYGAAVARFGETGVVELVSLVGYFHAVSLLLNATRTPEEPNDTVVPLRPFPL